MARWFYALLGLGFVVAGADKVYGQRAYRKLFRHWGWTANQRREIGAAEMLGGLLLAAPPTRRLGAVMLTASSGIVLTAELRHRDGALAAPRLALLAAAASALV